MIKFTVDEFLYEIKEEIICYEDLGEPKATEFEQKFLTWLDTNPKSKRVKQVKDKKFIMLDDESEIFDIVDFYLEAVEQKREDKYWQNFKL